MFTQTTSTVVSDDVTLFVRRFGSPGKTPILILHGANYFDSSDWVDVAEQLAIDREVAAFDTRGFGNSSWSANKYYGYASALNDIKAVLGHLGWPRAIIIGHSRGGSHALLAAARAPELTAGLVLVDYNPAMGFGPPGGSPPVAGDAPPVFPTVEAALETMTRYRTDPLQPGMRDRALEFLRPVDGGFELFKRDPAFLSPASPVVDEAGAHLTLKDGFEELSDTRCPVLIIRAKKSSRFSDEDVERIRANNASDVIAIDSGHDVVGEAPELFVTELRQWLGKIDG